MNGHYHAVRREISSLKSFANRHWPRSPPLVRSSPMEPSIYQYPDIFRRAHMESPGEISAEVIFLQQVWKRHRARPTRRVLDIACGDSPHGRLLAGNVNGFEVVGIDRSRTMIAAGRHKANALANLRFYRRPIEKFTLPERPFDAAIFMSETFPVLVDNRSVLSHLKSVGRALKQGGLYCIDIDRQDPSPRVTRRTMWRERTAQAMGVVLGIREFHRPIAWHSPLHSIYELECTINFPASAVTTRDLIPVRYTVPATLELAALASGMFKMVAAYCDLSCTRPLDNCRYRWMGVLRRV
jgi:SAM-dependent methyltransferase